MTTSKKYTQKFFKVSYTSKDGVKLNDLFAGTTPIEALVNARKSKILLGYKGFKVGKTAYNTLCEKF